MRHIFLAVAGALAIALATPARGQEQSWLDRPLSNWNRPAAPVPAAAWPHESRAALRARCPDLAPRTSTAGERALTGAGWLAFHLHDRQLIEGDVEIVAGLSAGDGMCRPMGFNLFVFVGGRFAGTLSPQEMGSRTDSSAGAVRLAPDGTIDAQFARYAGSDALCCPSAQVTVRYRIDRTGAAPLVVPAGVRVTRQ